MDRCMDISTALSRPYNNGEIPVPNMEYCLGFNPNRLSGQVGENVTSLENGGDFL